MAGRGFAFHTNNQTLYLYDANALNESTSKFRDTSAWYHIVVQINSGVATSYVNGVLTHNAVGSGFTLTTGTNETRIGSYSENEYDFGGYMAEIHLVDGSVVAPTSFGFTDPVTGIWMPKRYEGTYGTDGFYLDFSDNSSTAALGIDKSPNGNDFAVNNLAVTDSILDTPSNNFCTINSIQGASSSGGTIGFSEGNLKVVTPVSGNGNCLGTLTAETGKWYAEIYIVGYSSLDRSAVIASGIAYQTITGGNAGEGSNATANLDVGYFHSGMMYKNATENSSYGASYTTGDIIGVALDLDNRTINFYKNNSAQGAVSIADTGDWTIGVGDGSGGGGTTFALNYGQDSSFIGNKTAQGNTDANGIGDFYYSPPSGHRALCAKNLPVNSTSIVRPQKHYDTILYTGQNTSSLYNVTGLEFAPDLVWAKTRTTSMDNIFIDTVRGNDKQLNCPDYSAEVTRGTPSYRFLKDGFAVGTGGNMNNPQNYAAWCWKAGGSSNTYNINGTGYGTASAAGLDGGTIDPTGASINTESGFSIITYTGNGSAGATIAHGLGKKPAWIMIKCRSNSDNWMVYHQNANAAVDPEDYYFELNANGGDINATTMLNDTAPTSTQVTIGSDNSVNGSSRTYVMYCWSEITRYSKFGRYNGNSSSDGTYVHLGFRPAVIIFKKYSGSDSWEMHDSTRTTYNGMTAALYPSATSTETTSGREIDFLSNGFKQRNANGNTNESGHKYIFMAFAEQPGTTPFDTVTNAR